MLSLSVLKESASLWKIYAPSDKLSLFKHSGLCLYNCSENDFNEDKVRENV